MTVTEALEALSALLALLEGGPPKKNARYTTAGGWQPGPGSGGARKGAGRKPKYVVTGTPEEIAEIVRGRLLNKLRTKADFRDTIAVIDRVDGDDFWIRFEDTDARSYMHANIYSGAQFVLHVRTAEKEYDIHWIVTPRQSGDESYSRDLYVYDKIDKRTGSVRGQGVLERPGDTRPAPIIAALVTDIRKEILPGYNLRRVIQQSRQNFNAMLRHLKRTGEKPRAAAWDDEE